MCTEITVMFFVHGELIFTGSKIESHVIVTVETSSMFPRSRGDFQKDCFFKGWIGEIRR